MEGLLWWLIIVFMSPTEGTGYEIQKYATKEACLADHTLIERNAAENTEELTESLGCFHVVEYVKP